MASNRQLILASIGSGAFSLAGYFLLRKLVKLYYKTERNESNLQQSKIYEEKSLLEQYMLFNYSLPNECVLFQDLGE